MSPRPNIVMTSTLNVEKVVKDPQNPTPNNSFILCVNPKLLIFVLDGNSFRRDEELVVAEGKSMRGDENIPPNIKDPVIFIPAVCQLCKYPRRGSFDMRSTAIFEI
jgi:hypothetical protein